MKRVVVTGVGIVSPLGIGAKTYWENLLSGQIGIKRITAFDPGGFSCQIGGEVPAYKIGDYVPKSYRKATKVMARDIELAVIAADEAFRDAGLKSKAYTETPDIDGSRFGCNIGAGLISAELDELTAAMNTARDGNVLDLKKWGGEGMAQLTPLWLLKYLPNMLACHVTIIHGLMGPSNTITCADASSHLAIGEAFRKLQRGKADYAICGGAESRMNPMGIVRQQLLNRINPSYNDCPQEAVRPFDTDAAGTVYGEGGGLLILEEYEHAKARGAKIYAELVGFAASQDSYSVTEPDPSGHSYGKAIENALKDAKLSAHDLDLLIPHGLGIPAYDKAELNGLTKALKDDLARIPCATIKTQTSHMAAGSGVDAATAVLAIANGAIPPAVNTKNVAGAKLNVSATARQQSVKTAISSTYSLGGQNAALVFKAI
ncbi:MAG: beta-ketoacyl-[acyl-carrier-protein] synthase family protein [Burkholderiales bacterium]|nr:beta-ketoacyl-[acyl-carrier-protein] synthase family protein [Phycisphaerae bacterium]